MSPLEIELQAVKDNLCDMLDLVKGQLIKCKRAIEDKNIDLAIEIMEREKRVNIQELAIDRDCENILALYTPVATDLRLILATLKISNDLERIGDNAKSLARFLKSNVRRVPPDLLDEYNLPEMLSILIGMLSDMGEALRKSDTRLARMTVKKDEELNAFNKKALKITAKLMKDNPDQSKALLKLFGITRNLERAGDLTKNIAEEIVFHIDAKVLKHATNKK